MPKLKSFFVCKHMSDGKIKLNIYKRASLVIQMIEKFTVSADTVITESLVPSEISIAGDKIFQPTKADKAVLVDDAKSLWAKMIDENNWSVKITHDTYLKLYQLSKPVIADFDCMIIDEAQDCNFAMLDIIMAQNCPKILVGDPHQQIYAFRGARNSLNSVQATHVYYLTQSFRFGPQIAYVASCILETLKNQFAKTLVGGTQKDFIDGTKVGQVAVIARTNAMLFNEAIRLLCDRNEYRRASFVGGLSSYGLDQLLDILYLKLADDGLPDQRSKIKDKFILKFESFKKMKSYAEHSEDEDLHGRIKQVLLHQLHLKRYIEKIKDIASGPMETAEIIFTTAHKAKGLEFDTVCLTADFSVGMAPYRNDYMKSSVDEFNILYVAATRAKKSLFLSSALYYVLIAAREMCEYPVRRCLPVDAKCFSCNQVIVDTKCLVLYRRQITIYPAQVLTSGHLCITCATDPVSSSEVLHPTLGEFSDFYNYAHESFKNIVGHSANEPTDDEDLYDARYCKLLREAMGDGIVSEQF